MYAQGKNAVIRITDAGTADVVYTGPSLDLEYTYVDPVADRFAALEARIAELEARLDPAALLQVLSDQARVRGA
jgi:hypothetical protein